MPLNTNLDTQNEEKVVAATSTLDSIVAVFIEGDFDSANVEFGYLVGSTFNIISSATRTADDEFEISIGRDMVLEARATGASPDVNIRTAIVS